MELHVDALEAVWIITNATALVVTFAALLDARGTSRIHDSRPARRLVVRGNVRREVMRLVMQVLLLSLVLPGLTLDRPTPLTPFVAVLIAVPIVLLASSLMDAWDRRRLREMLAAEDAESEAPR